MAHIAKVPKPSGETPNHQSSEVPPPKKPSLNIELDADVAQGIYSNLAIINHSQSEFVVDFVSIMPGVPKSKVKSRIVLTPQHAKRFLKALNENVSRFEKQNGTIQDNNQPQIPISFGPTGEA